MGKHFDLVIPTLFGLEAVTAREVRDLGYETSAVEDGRVIFGGDDEAVARANLWIRTGERVMILVARYEADTYDKLFEGAKAAEWGDYIPADGEFAVEGHSLNSALFSVRDIQAVLHKAVAESMKRKYRRDWFDGHNGRYQIEFLILKNRVSLMIDTTGAALHKRGYRPEAGVAPLRETLAAALVDLSWWRPGRPLLDPFCGSGTIPIEAAMIGAGIAPGSSREFAAERWSTLPASGWKDARTEARDLAASSPAARAPLDIAGSDIDPDMLDLAIANAKAAGVNRHIRFDTRDFRRIAPRGEYGTVLCNPPYGVKVLDLKRAEDIISSMGNVFGRLPTWGSYILSPHEKFEELYGKKAVKKRKLYNGRIQCYLYQYPGPKPPRADGERERVTEP